MGPSVQHVQVWRCLMRVLLVASVPDPRQHPESHSAMVNIDVREAVMGLCRFLQDVDDPKVILYATDSLPAIVSLVDRCLPGVDSTYAVRITDDLAEDVDVAIFLGGTTKEVEVFEELRALDVRVIPVPTTGVEASRMFDVVQDQFSPMGQYVLKTNRLYEILFKQLLV